MMQTLSLCMIVKNEEKHLARCLNSVKDVVDEIVIVDTGSTDSTLEIAELFNASIFRFNWINDFSVARNFALSKCQSDWILYLDADEELNQNCIEELKERVEDKSAAINCIVKSLTAEESKIGLMKYPRLFPNDSRIKFEGKVHEQIQNSLDRYKIPLVDSTIEIIHYGYILDDKSAKIKLERNLNLLLTRKTKNHYDTLKLAQTLNGLKRFDEAEVYFKKLVSDKTADAKLRGLAYLHFTILKYECNDIVAALELGQKALKFIPQNVYLNYLLSILFFRSGNLTASLNHLLLTVERNKSLIEKTKQAENETILDQTNLYFKAIDLVLALNDESKLENIVSEFAAYLTKEIKVNNNFLLNVFSNLLSNKILSSLEVDFIKSIVTNSNLQSFLELFKRYKINEIKEKLLLDLNRTFSNSAQIKKHLAFIYINSDPDKSIELLNDSLKIEDDAPIYFHLISLYVGIKDYFSAKKAYLTLVQKFSNVPEIKPKIEILGSKLKQILNLTETIQVT
jgi:glycosyltransferase involved in cell wall biosynthesis